MQIIIDTKDIAKECLKQIKTENDYIKEHEKDFPLFNFNTYYESDKKLNYFRAEIDEYIDNIIYNEETFKKLKQEVKKEYKRLEEENKYE